MAEYTATTYMNPAKKMNSGVNVIAVQYAWGAVTGSIGDVVLLAKIPHGARIVDMWEDHTTAQTALAISFGLKTGGPGGSATIALLGSALAKGTKNRIALGSGLVPLVSVSDASGDRFGVLQAQLASGSVTMVDAVINFNCMYITDGIT